MLVQSYVSGSTLRPVEEEMAERIPMQILPTLRETYTVLLGLSEDFDVGGMEAKIMAAVQSGEPLAGFAGADWLQWMVTFRFIMGALRQPITELGGLTAREVFLRRYMPVPTPPAAAPAPAPTAPSPAHPPEEG